MPVRYVSSQTRTTWRTSAGARSTEGGRWRHPRLRDDDQPCPPATDPEYTQRGHISGVLRGGAWTSGLGAGGLGRVLLEKFDVRSDLSVPSGGGLKIASLPLGKKILLFDDFTT